MTEGAEASAAGVDAGAGVREMPEAAELSRLWLAVLREIAGRAAHEMRGALNGVALNLEVVRARAEKPGTTASGVASFAAAAADQLEVLTERTEALVTLARAPRRPLDVRLVTRQLVTLLGAAMRSEGGALELVDGAGEAVLTTSAEPECARLVLAAVMLRASDGAQAVLCRIGVADAIMVRVEGGQGPVAIAPDIRRVAADAGIGVEQVPEAITIAFPADRR